MRPAYNHFSGGHLAFLDIKSDPLFFPPIQPWEKQSVVLALVIPFPMAMHHVFADRTPKKVLSEQNYLREAVLSLVNLAHLSEKAFKFDLRRGRRLGRIEMERRIVTIKDDELLEQLYSLSRLSGVSSWDRPSAYYKGVVRGCKSKDMASSNLLRSHC